MVFLGFVRLATGQRSYIDDCGGDYIGMEIILVTKYRRTSKKHNNTGHTTNKKLLIITVLRPKTAVCQVLVSAWLINTTYNTGNSMNFSNYILFVFPFVVAVVAACLFIRICRVRYSYCFRWFTQARTTHTHSYIHIHRLSFVRSLCAQISEHYFLVCLLNPKFIWITHVCVCNCIWYIFETVPMKFDRGEEQHRHSRWGSGIWSKWDRPRSDERRKRTTSAERSRPCPALNFPWNTHQIDK